MLVVSVLVKGLIAGFLIAAPVGPINVMCVRRTIVHGRLVGLISGLGAAAADTFFGAIAAFGLTFIHDFLMREKFWFGIGGAALLLVIGVRILLAKPPQEKKDDDEEKDPASLLGDFTSTGFLTLTNPVTVLSFLAVFSAFGVQNEERSLADSWMLLVGVFLGSSVWWLLLTTTVALFRDKFNREGLRWANRIAGVVILAFAAVVLWKGATG
ncbi:MAG TPA: LysE family transporter [Alphaproteobacteria bacterium]|nr:LysE family transporter [Alphaproteobacteria bacterium]